MRWRIEIYHEMLIESAKEYESVRELVIDRDTREEIEMKEVLKLSLLSSHQESKCVIDLTGD
jgi:hypothetical protein